MEEASLFSSSRMALLRPFEFGNNQNPILKHAHNILASPQFPLICQQWKLRKQLLATDARPAVYDCWLRIRGNHRGGGCIGERHCENIMFLRSNDGTILTAKRSARPAAINTLARYFEILENIASEPKPLMDLSVKRLDELKLATDLLLEYGTLAG